MLQLQILDPTDFLRDCHSLHAPFMPNSVSVLRLRLRALPAPHGAEDDVDTLLAGSEAVPVSGVRLEFDCESLWVRDLP